MYPATFVPGFHDEESVKKMKYTQLGNTELIVSRLGFGGGSLGGVTLYGKYPEDEAINTVRDAIRKGVNFIDTAFWYGQGLSEEVLGKALREVPRTAYYIATKVGRYYLEPERQFDFTAQKAKESIDRSLKLLGLDYIDLIQVHDIEYSSSLDVVVNETLPTLEEAVRQGKAHYIGVTGYPVSVLKEAVERSSVKISTILSYSRDTLIDTTLKQYLPFFQSNGIGVIHAAANAMGLLTNAGPPEWHPAPEHLKTVCADAAKYCKDQGVELGRLAVHHAFQQPGPVIQLIGMNNRTILNSNLDVLYNGLSDLEKETLDAVKVMFTARLKRNNWEDELLKTASELKKYQ